MHRFLLVASILFLLPSVSAQTHTLEVVPDHNPWTTTDVDRLAVRTGNCMTWAVSAFKDGEPAAGAEVAVTDSDGRRSLVYTGTSGSVTVGTARCWTTPHVADHGFEVVGNLDGSNASSAKVVQEVMWSDGQVYADVPPSPEGTLTVPVSVVWTATNESMPVSSARVTYGEQTFDVPLSNGSGSFEVTFDRPDPLRVSVPVEDWLAGGPNASITVGDAGPFYGPGQTQDPDPDPPAGQGSPPEGEAPARQELPGPEPAPTETSTPDGDDAEDTEGPDGTDTTDPSNDTGDDGRRIPGAGTAILLAALAGLAWRRS